MKDPGMVWAKTPLAERTANARALRWVDPALWEELQAGCGSGGRGGRLCRGRRQGRALQDSAEKDGRSLLPFGGPGVWGSRCCGRVDGRRASSQGVEAGSGSARRGWAFGWAAGPWTGVGDTVGRVRSPGDPQPGSMPAFPSPLCPGSP